jgi:hypothetical protein
MAHNLSGDSILLLIIRDRDMGQKRTEQSLSPFSVLLRCLFLQQQIGSLLLLS